METQARQSLGDINPWRKSEDRRKRRPIVSDGQPKRKRCTTGSGICQKQQPMEKSRPSPVDEDKHQGASSLPSTLCLGPPHGAWAKIQNSTCRSLQLKRQLAFSFVSVNISFLVGYLPYKLLSNERVSSG